MTFSVQALRIAVVLAVLGGSAAVAQPGAGTTGAASDPAASGTQASPGAATARSALSRSDRSFLSQAAQNGHAEVESSKLAIEKASDPRVKAFATQMVEDHTRVNQTLKSLASSKGVDVPDDPSLMQKGKEKLMLSTADGADFDRRYADSMGVKAHEDTIELFEKAAKSADDPDVKAFAVQTLPQLQEHLKMARALAAGLPTKGK